MASESFWIGFLLGFSVAWPPGPINAEMLRRALERGFWSAASVGLGASSGDFLWALAVALATAPLRRMAALEGFLAGGSALLLFWLGWRFMRSAWRSWRARGVKGTEGPVGRFEGAQGGFLLGLVLACTSPWNLAFWFGVLGQSEGAAAWEAAMALASGVVIAAVLWSLAWSGFVRMVGRGFSFRWAVFSQLFTGLVMLGFALRTLWRGFGGLDPGFGAG